MEHLTIFKPRREDIMSPEQKLDQFYRRKLKRMFVILGILVLFGIILAFFVPVMFSMMIVSLCAACYLTFLDYFGFIARHFVPAPAKMHEELAHITRHILLARGWSGKDAGTITLYFGSKEEPIHITALSIDDAFLTDISERERAMLGLVLLRYGTWRTIHNLHLSYPVSSIQCPSSHQRLQSIRLIDDFFYHEKIIF